MWFSKSVYRQILCCAIFKASGQHLFYSVVLVGREEYLLWILTRETLSSDSKPRNFQNFLRTKIKNKK